MTRDESLGNEVKKRIIVGNFVLSQAAYEDYYIRAQKIRGMVQADFDRVFRHPRFSFQTDELSVANDISLNVVVFISRLR